MANKITVVLEALGFDKAAAQVKGFRQSVAEADGVTGKFKAGAAQLGESLKANAGPAALAAGTALVAFGVKAVGAFTDTAKAAIDMGAATGLATEDASRWIAVGDDFGIAAEQLEAGIGKIGKTLDDEKWSEYGIATRDAAGNARSANDVLIDSLAMLSSVTNETERARIGNELFGRGYANLAPLIGHTADEYRDMLSSVEKGQVITDKEADKAERMRLAQDALADALNEVTLAVGGMVAELGPAIEDTAELVAVLTELEAKTGAISTAMNPLPNDGGKTGDFIRELAALGETEEELIEILERRGESEKAIAAIVRVRRELDAEAATTAEELGESQLSAAEASDILSEASKALNDVNAEAKKLYDEVTAAIEEKAAAHQAEAEALQESIDAMHAAADATFALQDAQDTFADTVQTLNERVEEAQGDQEELNRIYREAAQDGIAVADATLRIAQEQAKTMGVTLSAKDSLDLWNSSAIAQAAQLNGPSRDAILGYIGNVNGIPPEKLSEIGAIIDQFGIDAAKVALDEASAARDAAIIADANTSEAIEAIDALNGRRVTVNATVNVDRWGNSIAPGGVRRSASGNPLRAGQVSEVNDAGRPEAWVDNQGRTFMIAPSNGHVVANPNVERVGGGNTFNITNNISQLVDADAAVQRLNMLLAS